MRVKQIFARDLRKGMILPDWGKITYVHLGLFDVQFSTKNTVSNSMKNEEEVTILHYYDYEEERKKEGAQC